MTDPRNMNDQLSLQEINFKRWTKRV